jgi:hypothetical protein
MRIAAKYPKDFGKLFAAWCRNQVGGPTVLGRKA